LLTVNTTTTSVIVLWSVELGRKTTIHRTQTPKCPTKQSQYHKGWRQVMCDTGTCTGLYHKLSCGRIARSKTNVICFITAGYLKMPD